MRKGIDDGIEGGVQTDELHQEIAQRRDRRVLDNSSRVHAEQGHVGIDLKMKNGFKARKHPFSSLVIDIKTLLTHLVEWPQAVLRGHSLVDAQHTLDQTNEVVVVISIRGRRGLSLTEDIKRLTCACVW